MSKVQIKSRYDSHVVVYECEVTFKLPDGFDPVSQAVKELEAKRKTLRAQFQMAVNEINDRLSKLQALTNEVTA